MFCDPLDIPDDVIAAQEAGELVVFVGAGVSRGGTSDLPLFDGLTDQIGAAIGKVRDPDRKDYDALLGEWEEHHGVRVHEAAQSIIGNKNSRPNEAHRLLLRLFKKQEHIRIVTTNYDRHFTTAAQEMDFSLPIYRAPALPLGDDFHGLVFLHGSVEDKPNNLVLTDADFGKAYLSQGWARTFLQALYAQFHVLFIGYSHTDILLSYLARGLPARDRRRRHAIQAEGVSHRWKSLGIEVIPYTLPHANLDAGLARWVQLSSYQPYEIRERIRQIVAGAEGPALVIGGENTPQGDGLTDPIQLSRDSGDFLSRVFRDPNSTSWFTERASDTRWIPWLHDAKHLPSLSDETPLSQLTGVPAQLVGWVIEQLLPSHKPDTLSIYARLGGALGPSAWWWAVRTFVVNHTDPRLWESPFLHHWLVAIQQGCAPRYDYSSVSRLVGILVEKGQVDHALSLFEKMLQIFAVWTEPTTRRHRDTPAAVNAKISADKYDLQEAWNAIKPVRTVANNERLFRMLTTCVENIYAALGPLSGGFDPVAGMRIVFDEPRTEHDPYDSADLVPVMLLEVLKTRGGSAGGIGEQQIHLWLDSPQVGWHRFAIYALRVDDTIPPGRKAELILNHGLVYPHGWQVQHDPEVLVSGIFSQIPQPLRVKLLEQIASGPTISPQENRTQEEISGSAEGIRNGFLVRLALAHRDDPDVSAFMLRLGMKPPESGDPDSELNPRDFNFGLVRDLERSSRTVDELLEKTPESQLDYFLSYQGDTWSGPNRTGLLGNVVKAANQRLEWARSLIVALISQGQPEGDLWDRLVWGLTWHTKEPEFRRWILIEIMPQVDPSAWSVDVWRGWSHHLFSLGESKTFEGLSPEEWAVLVSWSVRAWDATHLTPGGDEGGDNITKALSRAINHPAGRAVDFWMTYLSHLRRSDPSTPHVWPDELQSRVSTLMDMNSDMRLMGLAVFGQNLAFLRYALPEWTKSYLYPLLDIRENPTLGLCVWTAWLHFGRLSAELASELPPFFEAARIDLLNVGKETPGRFISYLAVLAVGPLAPPDCARWLRNILRTTTPEQRSWWIEEVARCAGDLTPERQHEVWTKWAKAHLEACVLGQFGTPSAPEFEAFLHWPVGFYTVGDEVLKQVKRFDVQPVKQLGIFFELKQAGVAKEAPDFVARYLRWLLADVPTKRYGYYGLDDVISEITVTNSNMGDLHAISASLLSLGYPKESEALDQKLRDAKRDRADCR